MVLTRVIALRLRDMLRERNYVRSNALPTDQLDAACYTTYASRDPSTFIALVAIPPDDFDELLQVFDRHYIIKSGPGKHGGPPRIVHKHCVLALVLCFYANASEAKTLCELFAIPPATLARALHKVEVALADALGETPDAAIRWPTKALQAKWAAATHLREPLVEGVSAFVDGKNLRVQQPSSIDLQNAYYNGWQHCVFVTGSWNDGEMSRLLLERLADPRFIEKDMKIASDSAFPVNGRSSGRIITPLKDGDLERAPPECRLGMQAMSDSITSLRQAAEWLTFQLDQRLPVSREIPRKKFLM
ncbi:TPA: hypothetical protein N0F65_006283 [Lagenidium giganteum]|uniref:DDE Tnp4 domain-containing protein n=1 Tax=Lagenidium giganteum TaxID=4803 RepID=A0AAV2YEV4_9STRA|nr:TPA: hypothetical protein N0F65_006283 [Lagenidium giganteum]